MSSVTEAPCSRCTPDQDRRELLRAGGLSLLGLSATDLARLRAAPIASATAEKRRRNACVFLFLFGGPAHIDLWDMKPAAPERGPRRVHADRDRCPRHPHLRASAASGRIMDKVCLLRSMTHRMNVHGPACSEIFSGRQYFWPPTTDQANREDWPSLSSLVMRYGQRWWRTAAVGGAAVVLAVSRTGQAHRRPDRRPHGRAL